MTTFPNDLNKKGNGYLLHFCEWKGSEREWEWTPSAFLLMDSKLYYGQGIAISTTFFLMEGERAPSPPLLMEKEWQPTHF